MKLLIVTQKVDRADPILGFFHGWLAEFAKHCDHVTVIGQTVGDYGLPPNVSVVSLGKEKEWPRWFQILRFWWLIWSHRATYSTVLVHMTPIWVVLGSCIWKATGKKVFLWYEARGATGTLKKALRSVHAVFSASEHGMPIATKKSVIVGHGIDTMRFLPSGGRRETGLLVAVGRITRAKRYDVIFEAMSSLPDNTHLTMAGVTITRDDQSVLAHLKDLMQRKDLKSRVTSESLTQEELLGVLQRADVFVHASETSLDKAVLEAMACGTPVVSCSQAFVDLLPGECRATPENFQDTIQSILKLSEQDRKVLGKKLRDIVEKQHGLHRLISRLVSEMSS